ncbi:hypothetical protein EON83_28595 [bacterium]|nr:MAG: hypothetical protein EON83_28595 [bacterium]
MQLKSRIIALPLAAVLASGAFFASAPAQAAPKSKIYKGGAIALGVLGAYWLSKGKTVEGAAAVGGGYLAYKQGEKERKNEKYDDRWDNNRNNGRNNSRNNNWDNGRNNNNGNWNNSNWNNGNDYRYNNSSYNNNNYDPDCRDNSNGRGNDQFRGNDRSWKR